MVPLPKMENIWGRASLGKKSHIVLDMLSLRCLLDIHDRMLKDRDEPGT